jgi:hypothetical protein
MSNSMSTEFRSGTRLGRTKPAKRLTGIDRHARTIQRLRASQSIPLKIAEGTGKGTNADRRRFFEMARGSALASITTTTTTTTPIAFSNGLVELISELSRRGWKFYPQVQLPLRTISSASAASAMPKLAVTVTMEP